MKIGKIGNKCVFSLTSLQIGDLQSYRSSLSLFLACDTHKFFILVDNRPWLMDLDSRAAHLWQLMVTKSRLSPFANTKARRKGRDCGKRVDSKDSSISNGSKPKKFKRWFSLINAAALSQKKALLPVKKLGNSMQFITELHRTLYGFIVFEVAWDNVRGVNYLNELQTDTSMAIETKLMKRWEFDSIEHALSSISIWFPGTDYERLLLREYLDFLIGEVFYDAKEDFTKTDATGNSENSCTDDGFAEGTYNFGLCSNFSVYPSTIAEHDKDVPHTPPPPDGPYKRRRIIKSITGGEYDTFVEETHSETSSSPRDSESPKTNTIDSVNTIDATEYRDVLILFRFNDRDLPFKLREVIMSDLRLLTLLESGLPSWVIFLQSYPVFCHLYRPWMCPLVRTLYVLMSVVTVIIGFYDLYKNVPVLKATASRLCGPLFDWIETWEMISRIRYLGTMLFLHNFEKSVTWFVMVTRAIRSFVSVFTQPMAGPFVELVSFLFPIWNITLQAVESFCSVIWVATESSYSLIMDLVQIFFSPMLFVLSFIWNIASTIIYPVAWALWEILYTPIRLVLQFSKFLAFIFSCASDLMGEIWLSLSTISHLASASEATVSTEISIWRSLWNDLFSQIFRAVRSIVNGFIAFFAACNRHRLSIYNHMVEFFQKLACLKHRSQAPNSIPYRETRRTEKQMEFRRKALVT
ncbi:hypothetical protein AQUCO_03200082v1 [Aquilegia coerulea]|uniref:Uncharacterized protein n=1 Tax=Aquilegia coerulea TaxID=218851 RepID=A0A2G5D018_AQUCA|nr:hypothetical protein AQUCO_03200082v1 [Aquilegia coerulea]